MHLGSVEAFGGATTSIEATIAAKAQADVTLFNILKKSLLIIIVKVGMLNNNS